MYDAPDDRDTQRTARRRFLRTRLDTAGIRGTTWSAIALVVAVAVATTTAFQFGQARFLAAVRPLVDATGGLLSPTLLVHVILLSGVVGVAILWVGGLRPRDVGLDSSRLPLAAAVTSGTWLLMQVTGVAVLLVQGAPLRLHEYWATAGALVIVGGFLEQLLGNALYEEVVYRGFLMPQVAAKLERLLPARSGALVFLLALFLSQAVFALIHVPGRLVAGVPLLAVSGGIVLPFLFGVLFVLVYYRTGNLFVAVGLHALVNSPVMLVDAGGVALLPLLAVVLFVVLGWPYLGPRGGSEARGAPT